MPIIIGMTAADLAPVGFFLLASVFFWLRSRSSRVNQPQAVSAKAHEIRTGGATRVAVVAVVAMLAAAAASGFSAASLFALGFVIVLVVIVVAIIKRRQ